MHALGSLATLAVVVLLTQSVLVFVLRGFGDAGVSTALFLASVVLSPLLFIGTALLYVDQARAGRVGSRPCRSTSFSRGSPSRACRRCKRIPDRLQEVNRDVEELGAKVLHQWATLGEFDFVNVVEAPDTATIAQRLGRARRPRLDAESRRCPRSSIDEFVSTLELSLRARRGEP